MPTCTSEPNCFPKLIPADGRERKKRGGLTSAQAARAGTPLSGDLGLERPKPASQPRVRPLFQCAARLAAIGIGSDFRMMLTYQDLLAREDPILFPPTLHNGKLIPSDLEQCVCLNRVYAAARYDTEAAHCLKSNGLPTPRARTKP
jgi:hypothetical protein